MKKENLVLASIHDLRILGRRIGVRKATALKKEELIEKILDVKSGKIKPYFSKKGRPAYRNKIEENDKQRGLSKEEIKKIDEILLKAKREIISLLQK